MAVGYNDMIVPADKIGVLLYTKRFALRLFFENYIFKDLFLLV